MRHGVAIRFQRAGFLERLHRQLFANDRNDSMADAGVPFLLLSRRGRFSVPDRVLVPFEGNVSSMSIRIDSKLAKQ